MPLCKLAARKTTAGVLTRDEYSGSGGRLLEREHFWHGQQGGGGRHHRGAQAPVGQAKHGIACGIGDLACGAGPAQPHPAARLPGRRCCTALPQRMTMPAQSLPGGPGSPGYMPSTLSTSLKLTPTALTPTSTSCGRSLTRPLASSGWVARLAREPRGMGRTCTSSTASGAPRAGTSLGQAVTPPRRRAVLRMPRGASAALPAGLQLAPSPAPALSAACRL